MRRDSIQEDGVEAETANENQEGNFVYNEADVKGEDFQRDVDQSKTNGRIRGVNNVTEKRTGVFYLPSSAGPKSGLSLLLHFNDTHYSRRCGMPIDGFKVRRKIGFPVGRC